MHAPQCSSQHYLQQQGHGSNPNVHQQRTGSIGCGIYTTEYYLATKRNEIVPFADMWMDLEIVIQSKVSQKERNKYYIVLLICGI